MASGVNVKMGVSGVNQFRQEINKVKQSLKTVDEALKLNEKEFKATGDAQAYMQTKTELLQTKLAEQKSILQNAEKALQEMTNNGVDKASKAFQDMQRQVLQAKGALLDTENELNGITTSSDDAASGVSEMNAQLANIGKGVSWDNVTNSMKSITSGLESIIKKGWQAGKALVNATLGAGEWADELKTTGAQYKDTLEEFGGGASATETLQRMRNTARLIDTDVDTILGAKDKLKKNMESQNKDAMGALAYLGIDPTGKSNLDIFWEAGEAISKLSNEEDKVTYAQALYGKSWRELMPMFDEGRKKYEETMDSWSVVSDEQIDKLGEMDDAYQKLEAQFETLKMTALSEFAEPLKDAMEIITQKLGEFTEWLKSEEGEAFVNNVVSKVQAALEWIADPKNMQSVVDAVKWIAAGWAAIKLTGGAADILKLINGAKNLFGGGGGANVTGGNGGGGDLLKTGGGAGLGAKIAGAAKTFLASGAAYPLLALGAAIVPAEIARANDEKKWAEQKARWGAGAENLTGGDKQFLLAAVSMLDNVYRPKDDSDPRKYLSGLQDRSDLQLMQLHNMVGSDTWTRLMEFWRTGGEGMADFQVTQLFNDVADAYTRMAEQTEEIRGTSEKQTQSNSEMTTAAKDLPGKTADAVSNAIAGMKVYIDGNQMTTYVGEILGGMVMKYAN